MDSGKKFGRVGTHEGGDDTLSWMARVRDIANTRQAEDEARNQKLEEDILAERKARQERREARAKSMSPTKTLLTTTPSRVLASAKVLSVTKENQTRASSEAEGSPESKAESSSSTLIVESQPLRTLQKSMTEPVGGVVKMPNKNLNSVAQRMAELQQKHAQSPVSQPRTPTSVSRLGSRATAHGDESHQSTSTKPNISDNSMMASYRNPIRNELQVSPERVTQSTPTRASVVGSALKMEKRELASIFDKQGGAPKPLTRTPVSSDVPSPSAKFPLPSSRTMATGSVEPKSPLDVNTDPKPLSTQRTWNKSKPDTKQESQEKERPRHQVNNLYHHSSVSTPALMHTDNAVIPRLFQRSDTVPVKPERQTTITGRPHPNLAALLARGRPDGKPNVQSPSELKPSEPADANSENEPPTEKLRHLTKSRARGPKRKAASSANAAVIGSTSVSSNSAILSSSKEANASKASSEETAREVDVPAGDRQKEQNCESVDHISTIRDSKAIRALDQSKDSRMRDTVQPKPSISTAPTSQKEVNSRILLQSLRNRTTQPQTNKSTSIQTFAERAANNLSSQKMPEIQSASSPQSPSQGSLNSKPPSLKTSSVNNVQQKSVSNAETDQPGDLNSSSRSPTNKEIIAVNEDSAYTSSPTPSSVKRQSVNSPLASFKSRTPSIDRPSSPRTMPVKRSSMMNIGELIRHRADSSLSLKSVESAFSDSKKSNFLMWNDSGDQIYENHSTLINTKTKFILDAEKSILYEWVGRNCQRSDQITKVAAELSHKCNARTVLIRQGQETFDLITLLGGLLISREMPSSGPVMFSCRQLHYGLAVDQVPMTPARLCSGFVFAINQSGNQWSIWQGRGSLLKELDVARLFITQEHGHIVSTTKEGTEDLDFWTIFSGKQKYASASYWKLKPQYNNYAVTLYTVDGSEKIHESQTFSQEMVGDSNIHIVDTYFELYTILPSALEDSRIPELIRALDFCKKHSKLIASANSRPFLPVSMVILPGSGFPRDLRAVARFWDTPSLEGQDPGLRVVENSGIENLLKNSAFSFSQLMR